MVPLRGHERINSPEIQHFRNFAGTRANGDPKTEDDIKTGLLVYHTQAISGSRQLMSWPLHPDIWQGSGRTRSATFALHRAFESGWRDQPNKQLRRVEGRLVLKRGELSTERRKIGHRRPSSYLPQKQKLPPRNGPNDTMDHRCAVPLRSTHEQAGSRPYGGTQC